MLSYSKILTISSIQVALHRPSVPNFLSQTHFGREQGKIPNFRFYEQVLAC